MSKDDRKSRELNHKDKGTWMPKKYLDDHSLTLAEAMVLSEIGNLDGKNGCYAMNAHFAQRLRVSCDRAGKIITELEKKGRLTRLLIPSSKGKRRYLSVVKNSKSHPVKTPDGHPVEITGPSGENTGSHPVKTPDAILEENTREVPREGEYPPPVFSEKDEIEKLTRLATAGKLTKEQSARFSYLNSKQQKPDLSDEFFDWFCVELLGRFDKFCVTPAELGDWYVHLFKHFGKEIATAAISKHKAKTKGWSPKIAKVIEIAKTLAGKERARQESVATEARQKQRVENAKNPPRKKRCDMTCDELAAEGKKYAGNPVMLKLIDKEKTRRKRDLIAGGAKDAKRKGRPRGYIKTNGKGDLVCVN